jgi:hypothetical protein
MGRWFARSTSTAAATLPWIIAIAGCGRGLHPVQGKVTLPDGTPVAGAMVEFEGEEGNKDITPRGDVQADGSYRLGTYKPGDGAPAGKYRVLVVPPPMVNAEAPNPSPFNARFSDFNASGLEFEVKPGKNEFSITVTK